METTKRTTTTTTTTLCVDFSASFIIRAPAAAAAFVIDRLLTPTNEPTAVYRRASYLIALKSGSSSRGSSGTMPMEQKKKTIKEVFTLCSNVSFKVIHTLPIASRKDDDAKGGGDAIKSVTAVRAASARRRSVRGLQSRNCHIQQQQKQ